MNVDRAALIVFDVFVFGLVFLILLSREDLNLVQFILRELVGGKDMTG